MLKWITGMGIALLLVFNLTTTGCYYDNEEELYPNANCNTTNLTYTNSISSIVATSCATPGCHIAGGAAPGIFESYAGVMEKVNDGSFYDRTVVDKDMPPAAPLSDCNLSMITEWINAGAPE